MKRVTAILTLFAIVGAVFAAGCSPETPAADATPAAGDAKMAPAGDSKMAPAGDSKMAPPGPGK